MHRIPQGLAHRLAVRDIQRHRGRTLLIALLIGLPLMAVTVVGVYLGSTQPTPETVLRQNMGQADYIARTLKGADGSCHQDGRPNPCNKTPSGGSRPTPITPDPLASAVPDGSAAVAVASASEVRMQRPDRDVAARVVVAELSDPLFEGMVRNAPRETVASDEVWISLQLAQMYDLAEDQTISLDSSNYRIARVVVFALAGSAIVVPPEHPLAVGADPWTLLVKGDPPRGSDIDRLNERGISITDRESFLAQQQGDVQEDRGTMLLGLLGVLACLTSGTIAGAAFSIGQQQQRRSLALLSASGADSRVLERLASRRGLVVGAIASVLGVGMGLALGLGWARISSQRSLASPVEQVTAPWLACAVLAVIGSVTGMVASWLPARKVARQDVLVSLRTAEAPSPQARFPRRSVLFFLLGIGAALAGSYWTRSHPASGAGKAGPIVACLMLGLAAISLVNYLLDRLGRTTHDLPLTLRMALRDLGRNRSRATGSVTVMVALGLMMSALLTTFASEQRQIDLDYRPSTPTSWGLLDLGLANTSDAGASTEAAIDAAAAVLGDPGRRAEFRWAITMNGQGRVPLATWVDTHGQQAGGAIKVGSADDFDALLGDELTERDRTVLADGGVLIFDPKARPIDRVYVAVLENMKPSGAAPIEVSASVHQTYGWLGAIMLDSQYAARALPTTNINAVLVEFREPTEAESQRAEGIALERGVQPFVFAPGPSQSNRNAEQVAGWAGLALLALIGAITASLARADANRGLAQLAAIGASPAQQRHTAFINALVTIGLGMWIGLPLGALTIVLARFGSGWRSDVPWLWLVALGLLVPVLVAALTTVLWPTPKPSVGQTR